MILQLRRLFERTGDRQDLDLIISLEELGEMGGSVCFAAPIKLKGLVSNIAGMVSLDYTAEFAVTHLCDRCLDEFNRDYTMSFSHILVRDGDSQDGGDDVFCPGCNLDVNELVISDFLAELPTKVLCRDDCLGLCPECGKNLNSGECGCACGGVAAGEEI